MILDRINKMNWIMKKNTFKGYKPIWNLPHIKHMVFKLNYYYPVHPVNPVKKSF